MLRRSRSPRLLRLLVVSLTVASSLFGSTTTAQATNWGATGGCGYDDPFAVPPANCVNLGNNYTHTFEMVGVRSDIDQSFRSVASTTYNAGTDLEVYARTPADVVVMDNSYGQNGLFGWVNCPPSATQGGSGASRWCYGQHLRFNIWYLDYFDTTADRQWTSCHEFGHTVGLRHTGDTNSCMNDVGIVRVGLNTSHDVPHINAQYLPY